MKINKINIISFGGLKNYSIDFSEGFNCIYGENENGKTTILSFIKMMFYGNERGSSQISKNIRKKYTPWDGSPMAGSIEFEENGKKYRLEREFRASNSTDKITLIDLDLGEKQSVDGNIGEKLIGLSAAAFERSIFIGQFGFPDSDAAAESEINARLSNMVSTGEEKVSFEEVNTRLQKARYAIISKSGKSGKYEENMQNFTNLGARLTEAKACALKFNEGKKEVSAHKGETALLIKKAEELKIKLSKEQDIRNAAKLKEYLDTKAQLDEVRNSLKLSDGTPADEKYMRNIQFCISKIQEAERKLEAKQNEAAIVEKQLNAMLSTPEDGESPDKLNSEISELKGKQSSVDKKKTEAEKRLFTLEEKRSMPKNFKKSVNPIFVLLGGLLLVLCAILIFLDSLIPGLVFAGVGIIFGILGFVIKPVDKKKMDIYDEEITTLKDTINSYLSHSEELNDQIFNKKSRLEALKLALTSNSSIIEEQRRQLKDYQDEINTIIEEKTAAQEVLMRELERIGVTQLKDANNMLEKLEASSQTQKELKQQLTFLSRDLGGISYEAAAEKLKEISASGGDLSENFQQLKEQYEGLLSDITNRRAEEASTESELKAFLSNKDNPEALEKEIKSLANLLDSQKKFCESADIAMEVLAESFSELRRNFGSKLETLSAEIFARLTGDKYESMTVSKSFGINVQQKDIPLSRETDYLSSGTVDQAYLSLRLAISELLSENKSLPLFLDDSLAQYDDKRCEIAINFLKEYSAKGQIIMFTCHNSVLTQSEKLGADIKKL